MEKTSILRSVKVICGFVLSVGVIIFLTGFFGSDAKTTTAIGIGTSVGAVFIFLMGVFFVASEEALQKITKKNAPSNLNLKKRG